MHTVPMTARKPLVVAMARHYVRYRLRRQFDGVFTALDEAVYLLLSPFVQMENSH